ncbi:hypothetical protein HHI36_012552 [Cryptolaemus montrouzieri]|uniref:Uncharacterized protein n=1 Tax=Cryptolaemus montrouzieri TaxID=559131 RepID=A0ABD2NES0_9CUCU
MDVQPKRSKYLKKYTLNEEDQQLISILSGIVEGYKSSVANAAEHPKERNNAGDFLNKVAPAAYTRTIIK